MRLAVVVINWNSAAETVACAHSVTAWTRLAPVLWVVDNASHDDSADIIARQCPRARLIRSDVNRGFAGGNNLALHRALEEGSESVLLLNNDAVIDEDNVARLIASLADDPRLGVVGPVLRDELQGVGRISAGGRDISRHIVSRIVETRSAHDLSEAPALRRVDYVPGTVALIRADLFRTVGLFDEEYFFGGELADFCLRARHHGYESAIDVRVIATHSLDRSAELRSTLHVYYIVRNRFLYIRKFRPNQKLPLYGFWTAYGLILLAKNLLGGRCRTARAVRLALLDGLAGRFGGQNERVLA